MFWSGDTVNADVTFNAYEPTGKKILGGISVWMNGLQKVKDGNGRRNMAVNRFCRSPPWTRVRPTPRRMTLRHRPRTCTRPWAWKHGRRAGR
ncbi:MAG: hypothetical protein ACLRL4_10540 [Bifidobacterium bifidum]